MKEHSYSQWKTVNYLYKLRKESYTSSESSALLRRWSGDDGERQLHEQRVLRIYTYTYI